MPLRSKGRSMASCPAQVLLAAALCACAQASSHPLAHSTDASSRHLAHGTGSTSAQASSPQLPHAAKNGPSTDQLAHTTGAQAGKSQGAHAAGPAPEDGHSGLNYYKLMRLYTRPNTSASACLALQESGRVKAAPDRAWEAVSLGVEGAGHNLLEGLNKTVCPGPNPKKGDFEASMGWGKFGCGGQLSFPMHHWGTRTTSYEQLKAKPFGWLCDYVLQHKTHKYVVLLRDPVDTFSSYLRRFWRRRSVNGEWKASAGNGQRKAPLSSLAEEHFSGWEELDQCVSRIPCEHVLFLAYEVLTAFPMLHRERLASFFGVSSDHPDLRKWLLGMAPSKSTTRASVYHSLLHNKAQPVGTKNRAVSAEHSRGQMQPHGQHSTPESCLPVQTPYAYENVANGLNETKWCLENPTKVHVTGSGTLLNDSGLQSLESRDAVRCMNGFRSMYRDKWYADPLDVFPVCPLGLDACA